MSSGQGVNWSRCELIISGLSHRKIGSSQKMMNYDILYGKIGVYPMGGLGPKGSSCPAEPSMGFHTKPPSCYKPPQEDANLPSFHPFQQFQQCSTRFYAVVYFRRSTSFPFFHLTKNVQSGILTRWKKGKTVRRLK